MSEFPPPVRLTRKVPIVRAGKQVGLYCPHCDRGTPKPPR